MKSVKVPIPASARPALVFEMTLHHVWANSDTVEGRGREYTMGWFIDEAVAQKAGKGNYVMGTDCPIQTMKRLVVQVDSDEVFLVGENVEISFEDPREVRARALAKLTTAERKVLGIED